MKYIVKDFPSNVQADKLESELNKLGEDGFKIISCEYVRHDFLDINRMPAYKTYYRVVGEKNMGKLPKQQQVLKG